MNLLLDSHALLWFLHAPTRLRSQARDAIADPERAVYFSAASVWELELKAVAGRLDLPTGWVSDAESTGFVELPITAADARASAHLPRIHGDPFDRILIAQAKAGGLTLVTRDQAIGRYDVAVLEA